VHAGSGEAIERVQHPSGADVEPAQDAVGRRVGLVVARVHRPQAVGIERVLGVAAQLGNPDLPGVQAIISRLKAQGTKTPEQLVTNCLDLLGPVEVGEATRKELTDAAKQWGDISWDNDASARNASQRAAEMMQLIAATREYQFG